MNAVGGHDDVRLGAGAIREPHARRVAVLLETHGAVAGAHHTRGQTGGEQVDEVGAVHAEDGVPAGRVGHLDRGDGRAVMAQVVRPSADARTPSLHCGAEAHALEVAHRVRRHEDAGAHLAQRDDCACLGRWAGSHADVDAVPGRQTTFRGNPVSNPQLGADLTDKLTTLGNWHRRHRQRKTA